LNTPRTSAAGRLYDAVASLIGLRDVISFEGQAAMEMEFAAEGAPSMERRSREPYPLRLEADREPGVDVLDWEPMVRSILGDLDDGVSTREIAAAFEATMIKMAVETCLRRDERRIVLTGGCFQNKSLTEGMSRALRDAGFEVFTHERIPPNDGGLVVGQAMAAWEVT
jgi:hydrogenase maturation protein HypF